MDTQDERHIFVCAGAILLTPASSAGQAPALSHKGRGSFGDPFGDVIDHRCVRDLPRACEIKTKESGQDDESSDSRRHYECSGAV